jgi:hypothetical protein
MSSCISSAWVRLSHRNMCMWSSLSLALRHDDRVPQHSSTPVADPRTSSPVPRLVHQTSRHPRADPTYYLPHSLWLHSYTLTNDHRSHAEVFELCPQPSSVARCALAHDAPTPRPEAIPENHHRRPTTASFGVAKLVHKLVAMSLSGAG